MPKTIQLDDSTYQFEDGFVRFCLLIGTDGAALIDSGLNTPYAKQLCEKITDLPILLINTHGDGDHTSGTGAFESVYMTREDYENCEIREKYHGTELRELKDGMEIYLGDRTLRIISIPGHTKGSIAILDVERRQLFAGDSVQDGMIFMFGKHRSPKDYESSLVKLIGHEDEFDRIISSHADAILPKDYTRNVLESWREVRNGNVLGRRVEVNEEHVIEYRTEYCGFYCD